MLQNVQNSPTLVRDTSTNSIINTDKNAYHSYVYTRKKMNEKNDEISLLRNEVQSLSNEINNIKNLIESIGKI